MSVQTQIDIMKSHEALYVRWLALWRRCYYLRSRIRNHRKIRCPRHFRFWRLQPLRVGMCRSFGGNGKLCGCRFQDPSVFASCERLRGLEDLRITWARAGIRVSCVLRLERFPGRRCARRKKRCIVSLDLLGKLKIRNPSRASFVYAGGRLQGEEAPARR